MSKLNNAVGSFIDYLAEQSIIAAIENEKIELQKDLSSFFSYISQGDVIKPEHIADKLYQSLQRLGVDEITIDYVDSVDEVASGDMNLNATYDSEDDGDGLDPYRFELLFNSKDKNGIKFNNHTLGMVKDRIIDAVQHEIIHSLQFRGRDFIKQRDYYSKNEYLNLDPDVYKDREYLGNQDEIEAFAKNISSELLRHGGKKRAMDLLRSAGNTAELRDKVGNLLSPNLVGYLRTWSFDTDHPVMKKLFKKVYNYILQSNYK